jgi:hypothetical protein
MNKKGEGSPEWLPFFCEQIEKETTNGGEQSPPLLFFDHVIQCQGAATRGITY